MKKTFCYSGAVLFNSLPQNIRRQQDACTGVHSACRREEMCTTPSTSQAGANAGISWSYGGEGGFDLQIWDLNRAHETETTVFPIHRFSACVNADYEIKESIKDIQQTVQ